MKRTFAILTLMLLGACARDEESKHASGIPPYSPPSSETANATTPVSASTPATTTSPFPVTTPPQPFATDTVPRIELPLAQQALATNAAILVDTRTAEAYQKGHVKGAINIPENLIAQRLNEL